MKFFVSLAQSRYFNIELQAESRQDAIAKAFKMQESGLLQPEDDDAVWGYDAFCVSKI